MITIRTLRMFIAAAVALLFTGVASAEQLRVAVTSAAENAPFFSAMEHGTFSKLGLDVKVDVMPSGVEISNALASNSVDVGLFGTFPFLTAVARGVPVVLIGHTWNNALNNPQSEILSIIAREGSGVPAGDLKALKGKKIGVTRGAGGEPYIVGLLKQVGLTPDDVTLVNTAPSNMATALAKKDVDVITSWEPWPSAALTKVPGAYKVIYGGCKSCYDAGTIVTTKSAIKNQSNELALFIQGYAQAQHWARLHRDEAATISTRWIPGLDEATLKLAFKTLPVDVRLSKNTIEGFRDYSIPLLVRDKRIAKAFDPAPAVDNEFVAKAMKADPEAFSDLKPIPADKQLH
ncbi:MAG TPA: ABC transporter substrate-binding protein [Casimicrobiaceae bacterium]|nr:ABC transporter substrate-binding protein [Casimicrobiaceae bacterium]HXU67652.1 ABC transporter substrate-binding protein [Casimicrobiaceae bacterium]